MDDQVITIGRLPVSGVGGTSAEKTVGLGSWREAEQVRGCLLGRRLALLTGAFNIFPPPRRPKPLFVQSIDPRDVPVRGYRQEIAHCRDDRVIGVGVLGRLAKLLRPPIDTTGRS